MCLTWLITSLVKRATKGTDIFHLSLSRLFHRNGYFACTFWPRPLAAVCAHLQNCKGNHSDKWVTYVQRKATWLSGLNIKLYIIYGSLYDLYVVVLQSELFSEHMSNSTDNQRYRRSPLGFGKLQYRQEKLIYMRRLLKKKERSLINWTMGRNDPLCVNTVALPNRQKDNWGKLKDVHNQRKSFQQNRKNRKHQYQFQNRLQHSKRFTFCPHQ